MPLVMTQPGPQGAVASSLLTGLVAYWKMDEASGSRADSAGTFPLSATGSVGSAAGILGNAAAFTGNPANYLSVVDDAALRGGLRDFTFDGWMYVTTPATGQYVLGKGAATSGATLEYALLVGSSTLIWRVITGASTRTATSAAIGAATWHYFCCWYDSALATVNIQLNGDAPVSGSCTGTPNTTANPLRIGVSPVVGTPMTGRVDEIGRWNRLLTAPERAARYAAGAGLSHPF